MSLRTLLLGLTVLVTAGIVMLALRHPQVSALFRQGIPDGPRRRLFLASIGFFVVFAVARSPAYVAPLGESSCGCGRAAPSNLRTLL
jgi:hypothetical protein